MGYKSAFRVRMSDIDDGTLVDVLEAIACFVNEKEPSVGCYPSLETIMRVSRKSKPTVRAAIKALREKGFLSFEQEAGEKRIYYLNLDLLPEAEQKVNRVNNRTDEKSSPGKEVNPVKNFTEEGQKVYPEGGKELAPEGDKNFTPKREEKREEKREIEQGSRTGNSLPAQAPWETDHFPDATKKVEEPKPKRTTTDRGSRLTITELPDDWKAFAEQEAPDLDPQRLFENFKDYWTGLSGAKAIKKDWTATWRNFVRSFHNAEDWKRRPMLKRAPTHSPSRPGQFVEKKQSERDYFDW